MVSAADFSNLELTAAGTAPSSDLLGVELLGEELVEIYNTEAADTNAGDVSTFVPEILSLATPDAISSACNKVPITSASDSLNYSVSCLSPSGAPMPSKVVHGTGAQPVIGDNPATATAAAIVAARETKKRVASANKMEGPVAKKVRATVLVTQTKEPVAVPTGHGIKVGPQSATASPNPAETSNGKQTNSTSGSAAITVTRTRASGFTTPTMVASGPAIVSPQQVVSLVEATETGGGLEVPVLSAPATPTVADFKSVAQTAVKNFILNASKTSKGEVSNIKVNTSAAFVKALTTKNWVATSSTGANEITETTAPDGKVSRTSRQNLSRQHLTPDQRAQHNRNRNREHARKTRLRKKAYVEVLQQTLTEMIALREKEEEEQRYTAQREQEQRLVRFQVMDEFLKLRARNESDVARWSAILENDFALTLPLTKYRKMAEPSSSKNAVSGKRAIEQKLIGTSEIMTDSAQFSSFLQTLGDEAQTAAGAETKCMYDYDQNDFFMDGCNCFLSFNANSVGAVDKGAPYELTFKGHIRAKFCPESNRLASAELTFDCSLITEQLQELIIRPAAPSVQDTSDAADIAAQDAATEADSLLESLQMSEVDVDAGPETTVHPFDALAAQVSANGSDE